MLLNSKKFGLIIEKIVKEKRITYMDAVVWYCEQNGLDTSQVSSLISKSYKRSYFGFSLKRYNNEYINVRVYAK